ncbi:phosphomannomutase/phosphoglucomutase [Megamonas hypermegale]|jgi:phosphomannomutase|uniref:Phosphomannomutase/phosphoglucomutase n=1 Tax=Megamonas hypermegale TaxID=158847 RepID=A0A239T7V4_9FIRM|nr:phosphomannomutase/phosphoglucomutase [Megamonas hypermegale]MBM6761639.1 phosphomannomutase/phosphoglucomutase [Megamonas hypermegale]OUO38828.1 phosphomannomutase/phosphoglucomutase [Megamonas hypermegale]SNU93807.1 Phosphomannomutase/phosphoglucomutase [Megamonas hypermegale]HJG06782.1 phosphomannomutase/phosphoglucomutase [Megamonas hypermegale]
MELKSTAFKAYDIRGKVPEEVNEELAYRIGRVFPTLFNAKRVAVGHDIRLSGPAIQRALELGLTEMGCEVIDIGQCGTEMIYFATAHLGLDGGIMITASHNPKEYNGLKLVRKEARPISGDTGLKDIEAKVMAGDLGTKAETPAKVVEVDIMKDYIDHLLTYVDLSELKPLKVVVNSGNGAAGPIIDELEKRLPFNFIKVHNTPDGSFPNGVPNPILQENREATAKVVREEKADLGVAFDGDFDRCFIFDENGDMIEGYYIVGFLAKAFLNKNPGAKIIYDPRLIWNTIEIVEEAGGTPIMCKSGHAFIKDRMRKEDAVYGGEMSAHNYFKEFSFCDSGMITWLLVAELLSQSGSAMSALIKERMERYPISGEINSTVADPKGVMATIEAKYGPTGEVTKVDGLSVDYADWRFNLRISNTEPVIRLNVETRGDKALLKEKTEELLAVIRA